MKYRSQDIRDHNESNGTCFQGDIHIGYNDLVKLFGTPHEGDGYKVDAEWGIKFADGVYATIYNYKDGKNYLGDEGLATTDIVHWHVGGKSDLSHKHILEVIVEYEHGKNEI